MSSDELPLLFRFLHNLCIFSTFSFDGLLLYIALKYTPTHMKSYSICIVFLCVYEILTAIGMFFVLSRVIPLGFDGIIVVVEGPCKHFPFQFCYGVYSVLLNAVAMFNIQMTACFLFRYFVLHYPMPSVRQTVIFNTALAVPVLFCTILFNFGMAPRQLLVPLIEKHVPEYDLSNKYFAGILHPLRSPVLPSIIFITFSSCPCLILNVCAGLSIRKLLNRESANIKSRTNSVHREFLSALVWQLILSQSFVVGVVSYCIEQFNIARSPSLEYAVHMSGGFAIAASPLVTLYFVKPYRRKLLSILRISEARSKEQSVPRQ